MKLSPIQFLKSLAPKIFDQKDLAKENEQLIIENNKLKLKNKKCQENIDRVNAHYKGLGFSKKSFSKKDS